jgi:hypothetical protein
MALHEQRFTLNKLKSRIKVIESQIIRNRQPMPQKIHLSRLTELDIAMKHFKETVGDIDCLAVHHQHGGCSYKAAWIMW